MKKSILHILAGREKQITQEEVVYQPLPHKDFRFANPIIVLHHMAPKLISPGSSMRLHPHPHRGFSPVTFLLQGEGFHRDSAGHEGNIFPGDVQWMFAGKGILHSEGPTPHLLEKGGTQELIQLWINVPKANKLDQPFYQTASKKQQPRILLQDGTDLRLVSGVYDGITGPLKSITPVISIIGGIRKGKEVQLTATPGYWTLLYLVSGKLVINNDAVEPLQLVVFERENDEIKVSALEDSRLLFISAEPINEPLAVKDNFVMNEPDEIEQAIEDYKDGKFGELEG